jgi:hypothetical protein
LAPAVRGVEPEVKIQFCTWFLNAEELGWFQDLMARRPAWKRFSASARGTATSMDSKPTPKASTRI